MHQTDTRTDTRNGDGVSAEDLNDLREQWRQKAEQAKRKAPPFDLGVIDSGTFAAGDFRPTYFVQNIFVAGQPRLWGGGSKTLKTTLAMEEAISIASRIDFLGTFPVCRQARVLILSGESGKHTLQETANRICAAKGVELGKLDLLWGWKLPQLANVEHMDVLRETLSGLKVEVVYIDPLYLCLLAGGAADGVQASNLFQMGPLLLNVAQACLDVNCTPNLIHHGKRNSENSRSHSPMELDDLAFAGIPEFARQWMLVSRREKYEPGSGLHRLWMVAGGSVGHGGCWSLDIDEGQLDESFSGRTWNVQIDTAGNARRAEGSIREQRKEQQRTQGIQTAVAKLLAALDKLDPHRRGVSQRKVRGLAGISPDKMLQAILDLVEAGVIEELTVVSIGGNGAKKSVDGIRRKVSNASIY